MMFAIVYYHLNQAYPSNHIPYLRYSSSAIEKFRNIHTLLRCGSLVPSLFPFHWNLIMEIYLNVTQLLCGTVQCNVLLYFIEVDNIERKSNYR